MHVRIALIAAALTAVACSHNTTQQPPQTATVRSSTHSSSPSVSAPWLSDRGEVRVRLDGDIATGLTGPDATFSARLVTPVLSREGRVIAPPGSLLFGHVVSSDAASRQVTVAFDRLQTSDGATYRIAATVVAAAPYAVTVRPANGANDVATLQATSAMGQTGVGAPTAIGGGPTAINPDDQDVNEARHSGEVVIPFDAELRLKLIEPPVQMGR